MLIKDTLERIELGRQGLNSGLPHGFNRLTAYIPNIQQGTFYLVGAETGVGKTAFVDQMFVVNPIEFILSGKTTKKANVIYFSFEIEKTLKMAKFIARKLYYDYGILTDINYVLSRGKNRISSEIYDKVISTVAHFEQYDDFLRIYDRNENPTGILNYLLDYSKQNGRWVESDISTKYIPNNPELYTIIVVDHVNLMKQERGFTKKENIDKLSSYMLMLRNKCGFTPAIVQQLNRTMSSADRFKIDRVEPQLSDFKDSGTPQEDANIVMALFSPKRYDIKKHVGYDTEALDERFRSLFVLKNRDGEADVALGLKYIGEIGDFSEFPRSAEMSLFDYQEVRNIRKTIC